LTVQELCTAPPRILQPGMAAMAAKGYTAAGEGPDPRDKHGGRPEGPYLHRETVRDRTAVSGRQEKRGGPNANVQGDERKLQSECHQMEKCKSDGLPAHTCGHGRDQIGAA